MSNNPENRGPRPESSNPRAGVTELELRELIDEEAWLRARRSGRARSTSEDRAEAEAAVMRRLGAER